MSPYYNDNGQEIDPLQTPTPGLCVICIHYDDPDQEIECTLTRMDSHEEKQFICYAFEKE